MMTSFKLDALFLRGGAALCAVAALSSSPASAWAEDLSALHGEWAPAETDAEKTKRAAAIEKAAEAFPGFVRGRAKGALMEKTGATDSFSVAVDGAKLTLTRRGRSTELVIGGAPQTIEAEGKKGKMSAREVGGQLVMKVESPKGVRVTTYELLDSKRLRLKVRMSGGRLKTPLEYAQSYRRKGA